jgi:tripartite-type tricarboxylate transporter receptor subunit TctC
VISDEDRHDFAAPGDPLTTGDIPMTLLKVLAAAALAAPLACLAQAFPDKPIRIVVPYAAGGSTDNMARVMQEPLQKMLGQPVIIDNKAGASGAIAAREVIRSKPDGYTLFFVNNGNLAVTPYVSKDANYDGAKDFTPIALVSSAPMVAVVPAALPVSDLRGFVEYAKKTPVTYASAGVGSFGQLATELFANKAGLKMTHIPYKGQAPTTNAVISGEVQLLITTPSAAMNEFIANKRLKLLGVTSPEPSPLEPGTPTIASVFPGYAAESWFAIIGPAGMPADIVAKLNDAIGKTLQIPDVQQKFASFGVIPKTATPQKVGQMTAEEIARWVPVIRENNIRAD